MSSKALSRRDRAMKNRSYKHRVIEQYALKAFQLLRVGVFGLVFALGYVEKLPYPTEKR